MNKFAAAYRNELTKVRHKASIWVISVIMVVIAAIILVGIKIGTSLFGDENVESVDNESYEELIAYNEEEIAKYNRMMNEVGISNDQLYWIYANKIISESEIEKYKLLIECNVNSYYDYRFQCANIVSECLHLIKVKDVPEDIRFYFGTEDDFKNIEALEKRKNIYTDDEITYAVPEVTTTQYADIACSAAISLLMILMIMLAGSSFSTEMSNGSVKSLVFAPVKRWKIFAAKLLMLMTVGLICCGIISVVVILLSGALFGFNNLDSYIYYVGETVKCMPFAVYVPLRVLVYFVPCMFFMAFAMMLSSLTRNTAVSICISLGLNYVGSTIMTVLAVFVDYRWLKYVPIMCTKLLPDKIFSDQNSVISLIMGSVSGTSTSISTAFMVIYIIIFIVAMLWTAMDAFCRRDIK